MNSQFPLLQLNKSLVLKNGIYQDGGEIFRDSSLSNYLQIAVAKAFADADSKCPFSFDLERLANTEELRAELSSSQFQFLRLLDYGKIHTVLDISEDIGGVAHFIADKVAALESIKVDPDRARLSTTRCANKHNVCHISEDLDKLTFPQHYYDLIVLGQVDSLGLSHNELQSLLIKLQASLTPHGVIVLSLANSERIGKWFNQQSQTSDRALAFADLYRVNDDEQTVKELTRKQLRETLLQSNFAKADIYGNFSQNKDCRNLLSEDYLTANVNVLNHFYRMGSLESPSINEYLLYRRMQKEQVNLADLANRFVCIGGNTSQSIRAICDVDFAHFPGAGRKPVWRTVTSRQRANNEVEKQAVFANQKNDSGIIKQNLAPQAYAKGQILVADWLLALLEQNHRAFEKLVLEYSDWLTDFAASPDFQRFGYDMLPFNILVSERGGRQFNIIDTEWELIPKLVADFVLFRALFWFAFENKSLLGAYAKEYDYFNLGQFVVAHMPNHHQIDELMAFAQLEEDVQAEINLDFRAGAVQEALFQGFESTTPLTESKLSFEAVWGNDNSQFLMSQKQTARWYRQSGVQNLVLQLPDYKSDYSTLRIDPLASSGVIRIESLILNVDDSTSIDLLAQTDHLRHHGMLSISDGLLCINNDPHLTINLETLLHENAKESALVLEARLAWLWPDDFDPAMETLKSALDQHSNALVAQSHKLNEYRADIEYQSLRIDDLLGHRKDLTEMLKKEERRSHQLQKRLQEQINHLHERLHAQHQRNDELHGYLLMRPSTRIKRFARRTMNRLTGKPIEEPVEEVAAQVEEPAPSPLPKGELIGQNTEDYGLWVSENSLSEADIESAKADIEAMPVKPVFSILVPIYNTDPEYLLPMIDSVRAQIYPHWQLCLVDDCSPKSYLKSILEHEALRDERICVQLNEVNQGISVTTNDALAMATGDYIALLDHDDEISIDALYENAKVINQYPEAGLIYSDEDKMDMQGNRLEPYFKPDYSPDLLDTNNYICHFSVIKKSIMDELGGFREGLDGSQDHDIILRSAHAAERVVHIPKILYHWRKIPGSTAVVYDAKSYAWEAGRRAVEDQLQKEEDGVRVEFGTLKGTYRVFREINGEPLVSIIIPFKDKPELLNSCLNSILNKSSYTNFEIIGVSNNSEQAATFQSMQDFKEKDSRVTFVDRNIPFNFSALCNFGVEQAKGDYVLLLNNDIEIISVDWIERLLEHAQRDRIGAVGGKLLYPDGRIQHAGVVAGMVGAAGHPHKFFPDDHIGYHGRLHMVYNVSAITGAMLMVSKEKYHAVGGLDEEQLAVAYNDIDFCLKLLDAGYLNVFTPHCKATHHESVSRGYEDTEEKMQRLLSEQGRFLDRWSDFLEQGDPYYNPNLSLKNERFSLRFKD